MIEKILAELNINPRELITHSILQSQEALDGIIKFYERIETQLSNQPAGGQKSRESYAYDHIVTHSRNVAFYATAIAREAKTSAKETYEIALASFLHDLEKIYWPLDLLYNKTKNAFTESDWKRLTEHPVATAIFVERLAKNQISKEVIKMIEQHHEDYNGEGYPNNLAGDEICFGARIIRVADSFSSMTSSRPYKAHPASRETALKELKATAGIMYDPKTIALFEKVMANIPIPKNGLAKN
ncbi:MAG: HD domain-containing protein [Planctomycetes bacterium]|nr:HD domain-containing protein [Planctomycetota bacterium]